jgi:peptidoglycan/LPS O-acetylase OafA/YrhL
MSTQRLDYVPALTGLRGLAAGAVVAFHLWNFGGRGTLVVLGYPLHALAACGYLGVDLFFVLSAFLLSQPFLAAAMGQRAWPALPTYALRRVRRVVPAFWAQVAILFVAGWAVAGAPPFGLTTALAHMFFVQGFFLRPGIINEVYWSLPVEWWFYVLIPPVAWLFGRARWGFVLLLAIVAGVAFRALCWQWYNEAQFFRYGDILQMRARIDEFAIGVVAAYAHLNVARDARVRGVIAAAGALGLVALAPWLASRGDIFADADYPWLLAHYAVIGALWSGIVFGAAGDVRALRALFANRAMLWVGMVSYSLYLWHFPVLKWTDEAGLWRHADPRVAALCTVPLMLVAAWLSYRAFERPFQRG